MSVSQGAACGKFEDAFRRGEPSPATLAALRAHAAVCTTCADKLAQWDAIDREAPALRREWASPDLMRRFAAALETEKVRGPELAAETGPSAAKKKRRFQWVPVAAAATLFILSMVGLQVFRSTPGRQLLPQTVTKDPLMTDQSLSEVETAEANYVRSIEKLFDGARSRIENPTTPLLVSYREKLIVLDSAIAEMRSQIESNRFNSHLRRELLAMYQEKQRTLQQILKEEPTKEDKS